MKCSNGRIWFKDKYWLRLQSYKGHRLTTLNSSSTTGTRVTATQQHLTWACLVPSTWYAKISTTRRLVCKISIQHNSISRKLILYQFFLICTRYHTSLVQYDTLWGPMWVRSFVVCIFFKPHHTTRRGHGKMSNTSTQCYITHGLSGSEFIVND